MNLYDFFDNNNNKNKTKIINKKDTNNQFLTKINKFLHNNIIDITEHKFIINFLKTKGSIIETKKFYNLLQKILNNNNIQQQDKNEFDKCCSILFKQLYEYIFPEINDNNINKLINDIEKYNNDNFKFTDDQNIALKQLCYFLYDDKIKAFGLYGFSGTGKTLTICKFIHFMLYKNLITKVVFTAPTNKATNVIKNKFRSDLNDLVSNKKNINLNFDDILDNLDGIKLNFMTIHKLLNYKNDFSVDGEKIFIKGDRSSLENYELVIIDEVSMISFDMIMHLFEEINKTNKITKILFVGDMAQLGVINENISIIFAKKKTDFNYQLFKKYFSNKLGQFENINFDELIKKKYDEFICSILNMKYVILKQVMRCNDNNVVDICNEMRYAVLNQIKFPKFFKYQGNKVFLYKYNSIVKTQTDWFKKCIQYFEANNNNNNNNIGNIIISWTNKQTDEYNNSMRKILYKKTNLNKFEIGDILMLTDFYNLKNETNNNFEKKINPKLYTSEQIKITDIEKVIKVIPQFPECLEKKNRKIKTIFNDVEEKYIRTIKLINKKTIRKYNVWKLYVHKLDDTVVDKIQDTYQIYVIDDDSDNLLIKDLQYATDKIKELRNYFHNTHKEHINSLDANVIKILWRTINRNFVDPFAHVNMSFATTAHKSQGSSYYNVFVDADDIFKNNNIDEAKRCLYTAMSRTSNELHLLI